MRENRVVELFGIKYPIIQAGMIWCSGWKLASAVSNSGGLGIIGSGSMYPDVLKKHIIKCKKATNFPFAVNLPLLYPNIEEHISTIIEHKVPIVFTSAGNPNAWTKELKSNNIKVVHVVSSVKFALKAELCGVDAVVAEGFEAGGHNGREETTTLCLIPDVVNAVNIPLIAAGGIIDGKSMLSAMILGADGVQMGTRFVACKESSAHESFKNLVLKAKEGDTKLTLKELTPVRMLNNNFYNEIVQLYQENASKEMLLNKLGKGRAKKGMFEGDLINGELEIGQASSQIKKIHSAAQIIKEIMNEFNKVKQQINIESKFNF
ncbi:MAG: nitronate monooxygenase [Crocinitomicaceae bacterium]|nr:nitronate monooxygenase [Crocinitomicaceae bacterium]